MRKLTEEATRLYDDPNDTRTFAEIYAGKDSLFEDVDDIISPKMKALFESVYGSTHSTRLREEVSAENNPNHNFSGKEGKPSGDGVCDGHNKAGMGGSDPCVNQSEQDYSSNPKLFENIYEKALLKESFDDYDEEYDEDLEDEFEFDATEDENEIDFLDADTLDDLDNEDFNEEFLFDDIDDGTSLEGSYENFDYSSDEFDIE
jgi:hypothetical protein